MKWIPLFGLLTAACFGAAKPAISAPVEVPATIDHNRVVIEVEVASSNGATQRVRAWVDNGNPELDLSRRLATALGLSVTCGDNDCSSPPPREISIGGMSIPLGEVKEAKIPLKPVTAAAVLASGMNVEINIPSTVLRHYDVLVDFPGHKFSIGAPGSIHFQGPSTKVQINADTGLILVPSQIENKKYQMSLDLGSCISFLWDEVFAKLVADHPDWPHMTGGVGSANVWGMDEETKWLVMRVDRVQFGPLFLTNVPMIDFPGDRFEYFSKRIGIPTGGLLGGNAFLNYRVGLDYAHSLVYFDIGRLFNFPEFDVIGLILRPEDDGRFTVLGIADSGGSPSVPTGPGGVQSGDTLLAVDSIPARGVTMGQVWAMLGGTPGQERRLTMERAGKTFVVLARVQHFLAVNEDDSGNKKKKKH